ncbi:MAG: hypothetical protein NUW22_16285, partial [Acidobacteria bacterium]|nr:hypothetical protein [Acidobacteriota bacterium]
TMTRFLVAAALVLTGAATAAQQKPADAVSLTGKWLMTLEMEVGTASPVLVLKHDGAKLAGTYTGRYGEYPLVGKVDGNKVEFAVTISAEGTETIMNFAGELTPADGFLRGFATLGGMGDATWLAKRDIKK